MLENQHNSALLSVRGMSVSFKVPDGEVEAVKNLNFDLRAGETLGIVGESGSGKSQTAYALMGLLAKNSSVTGEAVFQGKNILTYSEKQFNTIRAKEISMIFQDPSTSLNPYVKVGKQLMEVLMHHRSMGKAAAFEEALRMLDAVKIPEGRRRMNMYPHEFSGGMSQRVMIAMALLCKPKLLLADEPTTALDVTVQAQIIALLNELKRDFNTAVILITHDLGVIAGTCDKVLVIYAGSTVEYGKVEDIFYRPTHPYTLGLLKAVPRVDEKQEALITIPGSPPNLLHRPAGCSFSPRCPFQQERCTQQVPLLEAFQVDRLRACHKPVETFQ